MDIKFGSICSLRNFVVHVNTADNHKHYLYIPRAFVARFQKFIPENVKFYLRNGDIFEVLFNGHCGCFVEVSKLFERYKLDFPDLLLFNYVGGADFVLYIINYTCVEVSYPSEAEYHYLPNRTVSVIPIHPGGENIRGEDVNSGLLRLSSYGSAEDQFDLHIKRCDITPPGVIVIPSHYNTVIEDLVDETEIFLQYGNREWEVMFKRAPSHVLLTCGWLDFATAVGLEVGDLCVLRRSSTPHKFIVGIYKQYSQTVTDFRKGRIGPQIFIRAVDSVSVARGEIYLPAIFAGVYFDSIPKDVVLCTEIGRSFKVKYCVKRSLLLGLQELFFKYKVSGPTLFVFNYRGNGFFEFSIFNSDSVDILLCNRT